MTETIKLEDFNVMDSGNTIDAGNFNVIDKAAASFSEMKPIIPGMIPDTDYRVRKYGGIRDANKPWYVDVLDFGKELIPYYNMMTANGRKLYDSLPEPAKANKNVLEFMKVLDWTVGGESAIAFLGKKAMKKASKSAFKNLVEKEIKTVDITPPINTGMTYRPTSLKDLVSPDTEIIDSVARSMTKPELSTLARKSGVKENISKLRHERPLRELAEAEVELQAKAKYEKSLIGPPDIKPTVDTGMTYRPVNLENMLQVLKNQRGWMNLDYGEAKNALKESVGKWYHKPITEKDMNAWHQSVSLPHWAVKKFPRLKKIYGIERKRGDARAELSHTLLEGAEDFFRLKGDDLDATQRLLIYGDTKAKVFSDKELIKSGFNENVIKGYKAVRETLDGVRDTYWKKMKDSGISDDEIMAMRSQLGSVDGYFPRVRYGKFFMKAEKEGAESVRAHFNSGFQGAKLKKELEGSGYKIIEEGKISKLPEEVYFQVSPEAISAVFEHATKNLDEPIRQTLKKGIADTFKERGWLGHGITRQKFWEGFETGNLKQVMFDYLNGYAGFETKMDAARKFRGELMDLAFPKDGKALPPEQYKWATKYVRDVMSNADNYDRISSQVRAGMFYKYLGGVVKSGVVNLTQNFIAAGPRLSLETPFAGVKLVKAMGDIVAHYGGKKLLNHEERALRVALQKGWGQEQYVRELMGNVTKYGKVPNTIKKIAGGPMMIAERFNRQSTFLAGYRALIKKAHKMGMKGEEAFDYAVKKSGRIVEDSHFVYGDSNLPGGLRGSSAAKIARSGYTFRTFTHNYLGLLGNMSRQGAKGKFAAAKSIAAIGAVGGVSSIPFFKTAEIMAQKAGYNPRGYIKEKTKEYFGDTAGDVALYGLPGILDIDIGGSIGIEMPGQRALSADNFYEAAGSAVVDVLGVPASLFEDTYSAGKQLYYGDIQRAIEESPVTPVVVSNAMKARREYTEGASTPRGVAIEREGDTGASKLTKAQALKRGVLGFQSIEKSEDFRKYQARRAEATRWDTKGERIKANFIKMFRRYGFESKQVEGVWRLVESYNSNKPVYANELDPSNWIDEVYGRTKDWKQLMIEQKVK